MTSRSRNGGPLSGRRTSRESDRNSPLGISEGDCHETSAPQISASSSERRRTPGRLADRKSANLSDACGAHCGRVGEDVTTLTPHRSGRAGFPLPVPRGRVSLTVAVDDHSYRSSIKYRPPALPGRGAFVPSRQSGYPLSFRVQVYRVHAPSRVSRQWFSPRDASLSSFGSRRARFPALSGTMKALRLPICVSMVTYGFASTAHPILLFSCSAVALPEGRRALPGQGLGFVGRPLSGLLARGRKWDLSGLQAIRPVPLLRSPTPVEPMCPRHFRSHRCCPRYPYSEGFGDC